MVDMSDPLARLFHEDLIVIDGPALTRPPLGTMPEVKALIDELGRRSGLAQGLKGPNGAVAPVTVSAKLAASQERLYLLAHGQQPRQLIGLLKVGRKNLFHYSTQGKVTELKDQLSVLDFYVHEAWQRGGVGHALFAAMLEHEECGAVQFAYDVRAKWPLLHHTCAHAARMLTASPRCAATFAQAHRLPPEALQPGKLRAPAEQLCHI
jgi:GNAT superfamily N-acetyltransferase